MPKLLVTYGSPHQYYCFWNDGKLHIPSWSSQYPNVCQAGIKHAFKTIVGLTFATHSSTRWNTHVGIALCEDGGYINFAVMHLQGSLNIIWLGHITRIRVLSICHASLENLHCSLWREMFTWGSCFWHYCQEPAPILGWIQWLQPQISCNPSKFQLHKGTHLIVIEQCHVTWSQGWSISYSRHFES